MILMLLQEEQTVTFEPMSICYSRPTWYEKLFVLYLIAILIFLLVRLIRCAICLHRLRKLERSQVSSAELFGTLWQQCWWNARSSTKFSFLTLLLSLITLSMSLTNEFLNLATAKQLTAAPVLSRLADKLTSFSAGLVVCILLYACGFFFESRLNRHKLRFDAAAEKKSAETVN